MLCGGLGVLAAASANPAAAEGPWKQYATPEEAGWSSAKLEEARKLADEKLSAAVFVVYKGNVLAAWGDVTRPYKCHSVRKSLLSALYGIAVADGKIDISKTLAEIGIDDHRLLTDAEKQARISDLLKARSGIYHPAAYEPSDMKRNRPKRGSHAPGTHWWYNNWDFNTLGAIYNQETGEDLFDSFKKYIADPIGMEDFRVEDTFYALEPSSSIHPAYLFRLSARDLARFGQLFLQNGKWNGREIVPAEWVAESTTEHSKGQPGYGYMWWVYPAGMFKDNAKFPRLADRRVFLGRGTGGQFVMVIPDEELVFIHRGDTDNRPRARVAPVWSILEMVLEAKTGDARPNPTLTALAPTSFANSLPAPEPRKTISLSPKELEPFVGEYSGKMGSLTFSLYDGRLFGNLPSEGEAEFFPTSKTEFFAKAAPVSAKFEVDDEGRATHLTLDFLGQELRFTKTE